MVEIPKIEIDPNMKPGEWRLELSRGCYCCGGKVVSVRGRYPKMPDRIVCPTCMAEKLDRIREISDPLYGVPMQEIK